MEQPEIILEKICGKPFSREKFSLSGYVRELNLEGTVLNVNKKSNYSIVVKLNEKQVKSEIVTKNCSGTINFQTSVPACFFFNDELELEILFRCDKKTVSAKHLVYNSGYSGDEEKRRLYKLILEKEKEVYLLRKSWSWKMTAPIRFIVNPFVLIFRHSSFGISVWRNEGFKQFFSKTIGVFLRGGLAPGSIPQNNYSIFLEKNRFNKEKALIEFACLEREPKISIVVPVYNVEARWLRKCIESVINQVYPFWELCLYDDCSSRKETLNTLKHYENFDERIKIKYGKENIHISRASNAAIEMATGEYIGLLDNDDELTPDALLEVVKVLNSDPSVDFIYSDEDKIDENGQFCEPYFKSDFNPDLLLSNNYITHFAVIRKVIGDGLEWFRSGFDGAQDHDLFLRIVEKTNRIHHIPKVLYHWRKIKGSTSENLASKKYAIESGKNALQQYLMRNQIKGSVELGRALGSYRVKRDILEQKEVSIIIPFKDKVELLKNCVESIHNKTTYLNYKIVLINNSSREDETMKYLENIANDDKISVFNYDKPFNYSKINNWAVAKVQSPYIMLLNNDIEVISNEWLSSMVEHIQRKEVGAVGAKLLYADNTIQHAGVIIGIGGVAGHSHKNFKDIDHGYFYRTDVVSNFSACTAACLLTKRELYEQVGGLDEENLKIAFNDVDFCLKLRKMDKLVVYTPYAKLYHYESKSRGLEDTFEKQKRFEKEVNFMISKWNLKSFEDPYYNCNLTLDFEDFSLR